MPLNDNPVKKGQPKYSLVSIVSFAIATILVHFNNKQHTRTCITSLLELKRKPFLCVVDNGSAEPLSSQDIPDYPFLKLFRNERNLGFGKANNLAIKWVLDNTACSQLFLLNNDTTIEPDCLDILSSVLHSLPRAGAAAPKIVLMQSPELLWFGGGEVNWFRGGAKVPGFLGPADSPLAMQNRIISFATGCALLVKREVLEKIGGFDERYFLYEEDVELSLRIQKSGWDIHYVPAALVYHYVRGSSRPHDNKKGDSILPAKDPFLLENIYKNRLLCMTTHARGKKALSFILGFPCYLIYDCLRHLYHGRPRTLMAIGRGIAAFLTYRLQQALGFKDVPS